MKTFRKNKVHVMKFKLDAHITKFFCKICIFLIECNSDKKNALSKTFFNNSDL